MIASCAWETDERNCSPTPMITAPSTIESSTCATPARLDRRAIFASG